MLKLAHAFAVLSAILPHAPAVAQDVRAQGVVSAAADVLTCGAFGQPKNDWESFCFRGRVKAVRQENKGAVRRGGEWVDGRTTSILSALFDERGNKTEQVIDNASSAPRGFTAGKMVFSYDEAGRLVGWKSYHEGSPEPVDARVNSYDEDGNRIREETVHTDGSLHVVSVITYDEQRRKASESHDYLVGPGWTRTVSYNYEGNAAHHVIRNKDGTLAGKGTRVYDDAARTFSHEYYQLDARGRPVLSRRATYRYDDAGRPVESRYEKAEPWLGARAVYEYDGRSNLVSTTRYRNDGSFAARELLRYEYDARGNWVTLVRSAQFAEHDEPAAYRIERRTITYY